MRQLRLLYILFAIVISLCSCNAKVRTVSVTASRLQHTKEADAILDRLQKVARTKTPFLGHHDALMYGQDWFITENDTTYKKSDIYSVCGQYPYILSMDLGHLEKGSDKNLDYCPFRQMIGAAKTHYRRGGIITISWHMTNPVTDSTAWDCTAGNVVRRILKESAYKEKYLLWLEKGASFLNQLVDDKGIPIPVLFRPFHECNMTGFWWSGNSCSDEEYLELWKLTFDFLVNKKKLYQLLWVYSPHDIKSTEELGARYPGDEYVDIIGYERYQLGALTYKMGAERYANGVSKGIDTTIKFAKPRKKVVAFTETGCPGVPYDKWWTEALGKGIQGKQIAYVTVWRNGLSKSYYFGPCLKSKSSSNFKLFLKKNKIRMLSN